jgi:hypothetical protein
MYSIIIIGVHPPCPRCKLLGKVVDEKVKEFGINADVKHLGYTDIEAKEFAKSIGLEPGTAKDVAKRIHLEIDSSKINKILNNKTAKLDCEFGEYNDCNWSYELDELLRPFENRAKEVGMLMTPILIINGELKHQGSVPSLSKINEWLLKLRE